MNYIYSSDNAWIKFRDAHYNEWELFSNSLHRRQEAVRISKWEIYITDNNLLNYNAVLKLIDNKWTVQFTDEEDYIKFLLEWA